MAPVLKPLHEYIDCAIADCLRRVSPQFSLYLDEGGIGHCVDTSDLVAIEETIVVGEVSLSSALADFVLCEGIPIEHYGMITSRILHPNAFKAMLQREPVRLCSRPDLLETATPASTVAAFAGFLRIFLGSGGVQKWFAAALGEAVRAAARVCIAHAQSLEDDPVQAQMLRQKGRERALARIANPRLSLLALLLDLPLAALAGPRSTGLFSSGVAKLWLSNAHKFAVSLSFKGFKSPALTNNATGDIFRRGKTLFFKSPASPPASPSRFRRSRAPSPDSSSKFLTSSALVPWNAPDLARVPKRRKVSDVYA